MELISGYKIPYDPWPILNRLDSDRESAVDELWENLYHQGDIGSASYAAVPKLVEAGELSLVAAIEVARQSEHNSVIPESLEADYYQALNLAMKLLPRSEEQLQGYYVIHASIYDQPNLAKALHLLGVEEILAEYG